MAVCSSSAPGGFASTTGDGHAGNTRPYATGHPGTWERTGLSGASRQGRERLTMSRTRTAHQRARQRAARAWRAGQPHRALEIMEEAGLRDEWPVFVRVAARTARARYERRMSTYTR